MILKIHLQIGILATACLCLNAWAKEKDVVTDQWKTECVGRVQMDLPDRVEFALGFSLKQTGKKEAPGIRYFEFENGDVTGEADYRINDTLIDVSRDGNIDDFLRYKQNFIKQRQEDRKKKKGLLALPPVMTKAHKTELPNSFAWSWHNDHIQGHLFRANRVFVGRVLDYKEEHAVFPEERFRYFLTNFSPRAIFELPSQQGICFPYGFIRDDGTKLRYVSVAMRLLDHPDVEIVFLDTYARKVSPHRLPEYKGSRDHAEDSWSSYEIGESNELTINHYHDVDLGGFTGKYATATIARPLDPAGTTRDRENQEQYSIRVEREMAEGKYLLDYGYMAYYKGDPDKPGEPDLKLSVIRTASRALKAGKTPVTQEELYAIAKKIAASIKRRPVQ